MLLMSKDDCTDLPVGFEVPQESCPELGMGLHDLPFLVVQRRLLQEDPIGNAQLADIMQQERVLQFSIDVYPDAERDDGAQLQDVSRMAGCVGVPYLQ